MDEYDEYARKLRAAEMSSDDYDEYARKLRGGVLSDVAKSVAVAPAKAVTGLAGLPGTVREIGTMVRDKVSPYLPEWMRKAENFGGGIAALSNPLAFALPSGGAIRGAAESGLPFGQWYDPVTWQGKAADTAAQAAATMGRSLVTNPMASAAGVAGVTAGTETARHLTDENPLAMFIGGLLGVTPVAGVNAIKSRPGTVVKNALGDLSQAQIAAAIAQQNAAKAQGVPLMGTESLDRGHQLASAVRASPTGNPIIERFLAMRPAQVGTAVERDILRKTGSTATPQEAAQTGQAAATARIAKEEAARTAAVQPYYESAKFADVPAGSLRPVANEIQSLMFNSAIGSPVEKSLGNWYQQLFPHSVAAEKSTARRVPNARASVDEEVDDLITAVRKLGGINPADEAVGSLAKANPFPPHPQYGSVWTRRTGGSLSSSGHSLDTMAMFLNERGYPVTGPDDLMDAIANASMGKHTYSVGRDYAAAQNANDPLTDLNDTLVELTRQMRIKNNPVEAAKVKAVLPETNVGRLNEIYKRLGIESDTSAIGVTPDQKIAAYPAQRVRDTLGDVLKNNNPDIAHGQRLYADITKNKIDPLTAGPVGVVAGRSGFDPAAPSSWPRVSSVLSNGEQFKAGDVRSLAVELNATDKNAFPAIAHAWIANELDAAVKPLRSGPNPTAGAKFFDAVYGSPDQAAKFDQVMVGVAKATGRNPADVVRGAKNLLKTLDLTGRTPGIGSQTQPRQEVGKELGKNIIGDIGHSVSAQPLSPLMQRIDDWIMRGRYEDLARALTAPDSVQLLVKMAKLSPNGLTAKYYAAALLGLDPIASGR